MTICENVDIFSHREDRHSSSLVECNLTLTYSQANQISICAFSLPPLPLSACFGHISWGRIGGKLWWEYVLPGQHRQQEKQRRQGYVRDHQAILDQQRHHAEGGTERASVKWL